MTTLVASIIVFGLLIFVHELGHFAIAKLVGIKIHEFSMGFGPRLAGYTAGETYYNLRLFPLGGFVRMAGMDPEEEEVEAGKGFNDKSVLQRISVILAGPVMNFILAAVLFAGIFMFMGVAVPDSATTEVRQTIPDQPAAEAGIKAGDQIIAINGVKVDEWEEITKMIGSNPEEEISITVRRDSRSLTFNLVPVPDEEGTGKVGIFPESEYDKQGPLQALTNGFREMSGLVLMILDFLGQMIFGQQEADVGGPVRVIHEINRATEIGLFYLVHLTAFLSINLGLFNLFPIPALDGSRIMFLLVEWVRGRPLDPAKENFIHMIGFGLLLMFIMFITYNDVLQLFIKQGN